MYFNNLKITSDNVLINKNLSYDDVLTSIMEYTEVHYGLESKINLFEADRLLKEENTTSNNSNANTSQASNDNSNSNLKNTIREYSAKLTNILQKVIAKIKDYISIIWNKLKEIMAKIQEQIEKLGVEKALNDISSNPKNYKYDNEYFNSSVANTEYATPRSDKILEAYKAIANKYLQCSGELNTRNPDELSQPVKDEEKENLKNLQNAKTKGSEFSKDPNTDYFSNDVNKSLSLVFGLYNSLKSNKYETVCKPFTDIVAKINNNVSNVGKSLSRDIAAAAQKNNTEDVKKYQARAKELIAIGNAITSLSGGFRTQMVQMNISRLKIINTFIKLWKIAKNEGNTENKENKTEEPNQEKQSENVNDAKAP